jgi:hypothetical protein
VSSLEARLTEGYARVHQLEREALRLERASDRLLADGGTPAQISATLTERRAIERELEALRRQLDASRSAHS